MPLIAPCPKADRQRPPETAAPGGTQDLAGAASRARNESPSRQSPRKREPKPSSLEPRVNGHPVNRRGGRERHAPSRIHGHDTRQNPVAQVAQVFPAGSLRAVGGEHPIPALRALDRVLSGGGATPSRSRTEKTGGGDSEITHPEARKRQAGTGRPVRPDAGSRRRGGLLLLRLSRGRLLGRSLFVRRSATTQRQPHDKNCGSHSVPIRIPRVNSRAATPGKTWPAGQPCPPIHSSTLAVKVPTGAV